MIIFLVVIPIRHVKYCARLRCIVNIFAKVIAVRGLYFYLKDIPDG